MKKKFKLRIKLIFKNFHKLISFQKINESKAKFKERFTTKTK